MSTFTVLRWIKYGGLAAIQPSRKYLIREDVLDAWLARGPSRPMPDKADSNLIDLARAFRKREK